MSNGWVDIDECKNLLHDNGFYVVGFGEGEPPDSIARFKNGEWYYDDGKICNPLPQYGYDVVYHVWMPHLGPITNEPLNE